MLNLEDSTNQPTPVNAPLVASQNPDFRRLPGPERHASVTPIDMRQARFSSAVRGFTKTEVTAFLEEAAADYEHSLRENERLRQQIAGMEVALAQYRELEGSLKNMLISAQKVADDMRENAEKEAARLMREAEGRVELMVQKAHARVDDANREIDTLKLKRRDAQTNIEACVAALQSTLEFVREQEQKDRDHRVVPHRAMEIAKQSA